MTTVAVIGAGYVGLVQGVALASLGHDVRLAELDEAKAARIAAGDAPIHEEGLDDLLREVVDAGRLTVHSDNLEAIDGATVVFLALPTPPGLDGEADLTIVRSVVHQIAPALTSDQVLVTKSTVPVGTAAELEQIVRAAGSSAAVASNPEFLAEGTALRDFLQADRIVIGVDDPAAGKVLADLYASLPSQVIVTDRVSSELSKYAANSYLASRLTFANSIANIAEEVGADALEVLRIIGLDDRIGSKFLNPGPGFGGSCFPKDTAAMLATTRRHGYRFSLLESVIEVDKLQRTRIVERCADVLGGLDGAVIAIWGLAFKANTDDTRDSPGLKLAELLHDRSATVRFHDPLARTDRYEQFGSEVEAAAGADLVLVATEWKSYQTVDFDQVAAAMAGDVIYDVRNILDPDTVRSAGLRYLALGRPGI